MDLIVNRENCINRCNEIALKEIFKNEISCIIQIPFCFTDVVYKKIYLSNSFLHSALLELFLSLHLEVLYHFSYIVKFYLILLDETKNKENEKYNCFLRILSNHIRLSLTTRKKK